MCRAVLDPKERGNVAVELFGQHVVDGPFAADCFEQVPVTTGQVGGHIPAIAATKHADPVGVAEAVPGECRIQHSEDVIDIDAAPPSARGNRVFRAKNCLAPGLFAAASPARVTHQDHVAVGRLDLSLIEECLAVLRVRATMHI